jgi:hypothetical protein
MVTIHSKTDILTFVGTRYAFVCIFRRLKIYDENEEN